MNELYWFTDDILQLEILYNSPFKHIDKLGNVSVTGFVDIPLFMKTKKCRYNLTKKTPLTQKNSITLPFKMT